MSVHKVFYTAPDKSLLIKKAVIFEVNSENNGKIGSLRVSTAGIFWKNSWGKRPSWKKLSWEKIAELFKAGQSEKVNKKKGTKDVRKSIRPRYIRKPNPVFMKPRKASPDLAAIIGIKPMARTQITKKLWEYIKKHQLQDRHQKTMINADAKLKKIFNGKRQVSMFEMTKLVSKHIF